MTREPVAAEGARGAARGNGRTPAAGPAMRHGVMLEMNAALVLEHVRRRGESSRPEIASALGLSAASVSRIVRRLIDEGRLVEGPGASTGGRPRSVIRFNPLAGCVIGVDLGGSRSHGILADLAGARIATATRALDGDRPPFAELVATIRALQRRARAAGLEVAAVGVGVAASVDPATGIARGGPTVRWDEFPIASELAAAIDLPFVVDNDVNLAALAHATRGDARGRAGFAVLSLGPGIGAAIVSEGRLLRGHRGGAGEVGYLVLDRARLRDRAPGTLGAFEAMAAEDAIVATVMRRLAADPAPSVLRTEAGRPAIGAILAGAAGSDPIAAAVVAELIDHVAMAVIAIGATIGPELVILDGSVGAGLEPWRRELDAVVARHLPSPPSIAVSSLGTDAGALGAVVAALQLARRRRMPAAPDPLAWGAAGETMTRLDVA